MEISLIVSIISAVATIAAAIIYFYTLSELKKQRANTYKPHLFVDNSRFGVNGIRKDGIIMPLNWSDINTGPQVEEYDPTKFAISRFNLKCYNIGFGTATKVNIKFSYLIDEFIENIKEVEKQIPENLKITIEKKSAFISFDSENQQLPFKSNGIPLQGNLESYIGYILPVHIKNDFSSVPIPSHFLELMNIYLFYKSMLLGKTSNNIDIPILNIEIKYADITNKSIISSLAVLTKVSMYSKFGFDGEFIVIESN